MDTLIFGVFGGFIIVLIYMSIIVGRLDQIIDKLEHLRNASWKQHTIEANTTHKELGKLKSSIWGAGRKK